MHNTTHVEISALSPCTALKCTHGSVRFGDVGEQNKSDYSREVGFLLCHRMGRGGHRWMEEGGKKNWGGQGGTWGAKENNASLRSLADFPGVEDGSGRKRTGFVVENVSVLLLLLPLLSKFRPAKQQGGEPATICHLQSELWARLIRRHLNTEIQLALFLFNALFASEGSAAYVGTNKCQRDVPRTRGAERPGRVAPRLLIIGPGLASAKTCESRDKNTGRCKASERGVSRSAGAAGVGLNMQKAQTSVCAHVSPNHRQHTSDAKSETEQRH